MLDDREAVWALVGEVVVAVEADLGVLVASLEDRVIARVQATNGGPSAALREALRRGVSAAIRDALARLRCLAELPQELPPDLVELARVYAESGWEPAGLADPWLVGEEAFWDRFQVVAERTLGDSALCWEVIKAARARLTNDPARLSEPFFRACEREVARQTGTDEDSRLRAVSRALDGHWVDPGELGYDLASHHVALVADTAPSLDAMARSTERQPLQVQTPDDGIWGWLGGQTAEQLIHHRVSDRTVEVLIALRVAELLRHGD